MIILIFRSQYDRLVVYAPTGTAMQPTYSLSVDDDGVLSLSQSGQINLYDKIQASRDSVELKTILERYESDGIPPIDAKHGFFADVTRLPSSLAGFFDQIHSAEAAFNGLPADIRAQFGHSLSQFVTTAGTIDWYNKLGINNNVETGVNQSVDAGGDNIES